MLAGAGSGKTRVLVHRIAWLIQSNRPPHSILSVTFTNKAAAEMRQRIEQLLGINPAGMWVGTFHGLAHRLLRAHWQEARLVQNFQILDSDDQQRLIKRVIRELGLDEQRWPARQAQWFINGQKDEGLRPQHIQAGGDLFPAPCAASTRPTNRPANALGSSTFPNCCFAPWTCGATTLTARTLPAALPPPAGGRVPRYQRRAVRLAAPACRRRQQPHGGGDDDQSIYGWRGAKIENIHQYTADFPDAELIRLEQNYRSTGGILKAANALIANNSGRLGKELWTDMGEGEPLTLYAAYNEHDEARYVVETIESFIKQGNARSDVAILYRSTPSRGCSKKPCCANAFPIGSTVANASSSAPRSRTPWPTCACSKAAATTPRWSG